MFCFSFFRPVKLVKKPVEQPKQPEMHAATPPPQAIKDMREEFVQTAPWTFDTATQISTPSPPPPPPPPPDNVGEKIRAQWIQQEIITRLVSGRLGRREEPRPAAKSPTKEQGIIHAR